MSIYNLSDGVKEGDELSYNIITNRKKIYYNIINFYNQKDNNGIFAENILRLTLNGVNLNHLSKNHPHVDIAIVNPINGVTKEDEVISAKSSIGKKLTLAGVISNTKAIKLESMLSYVVFANSSFQVDYKKEFVNAKSLLSNAIKLIRETKNPDYLAVVNVCLYYILNIHEEFNKDFESDIKLIGDEHPDTDYNLKYGLYSFYKNEVERKIKSLKIPISLGCIYMDGMGQDIRCVIKKTNAIDLSEYWFKLVNIWNRKGYFGVKVTKYLSFADVKDLFDITTKDFPIEIKISVGEYKPSKADYSRLPEDEKALLGREMARKKTKELYVATKFKDADFGKQSDQVNNFFLDAINKLQRDPSLITKFTQFSKTLSV